MEDDPDALIYVSDGDSGPVTRVRGCPLSVNDIVATYRRRERSVAATADYLALPCNIVEAAIRYYTDHADELEQEILAELKAEERAATAALAEAKKVIQSPAFRRALGPLPNDRDRKF